MHWDINTLREVIDGATAERSKYCFAECDDDQPCECRDEDASRRYYQNVLCMHAVDIAKVALTALEDLEK